MQSTEATALAEAPRRVHRSARIAAFVAATPEERARICRLGFELETNRSDGVTLDDVGEGEYDDYPQVAGLETVDDYTVEGFEFRTSGGKTRERCGVLLEDLYRMPHAIGKDCGFHVHFSIPGVIHRWGAVTQRRMIGAVLALLPKVPTTVLRRWAHSTVWFRFAIQDAKGPFVSARPEVGANGTWEFRCWGNTKTRTQAERCLDLTVEAAAMAYDPNIKIPEWTHDSALALINAELTRRLDAAAAKAAAETADNEGATDVA